MKMVEWKHCTDLSMLKGEGGLKWKVLFLLNYSQCSLGTPSKAYFVFGPKCKQDSALILFLMTIRVLN